MKCCKMKKAALALGITAAVAGIGYYAKSEYFYRKLIQRSKKAYVKDANLLSAESWEKRIEINEEMDVWEEGANLLDVCTISFDGTQLASRYYVPDEESNQWVLIVHGYMSNAKMMRYVAKQFVGQGFHTLLSDCRGHGQSEGSYIGMGWHDRKDIMAWIDYILSENPAAEIVLYGQSMGASAVMMASGEALPDNVKCVIEDGGYTTAYEALSAQLRSAYSVPPQILLAGVSMIAKWRAKYTLKEASALKQLEKATLPTLFIHGEEDRVVPLDHVFTLYHTLNAEKELYTVPYAGHCESMLSPRYFQRVFLFIRHHVK